MVRSITDVATTWVYPYWHALCLLDSLPLIGGKSCASPSTLPANAPADGTLRVTADSLTALNAASLLIGGTRIDNADGTTNLVLTAQTISVANDVAHPLSAPEIILARSEEHTSELQSLMRISYAVFCLKKNKTNTK